MLEVLEYLTHYHTFAVKFTENQRLIDYQDLCSTQLLHASSSHFCYGTVKFVTLKYGIF